MLIDIVTQPNELDQGTLGNLIKNLYPATKVPNGMIVKVIGSLGHGHSKPSYATQAALLKWLVMIYDVLENQKLLSRFYGILFNLLDTLSIRYALFAHPWQNADYYRPQICHVLSLITRRKHVRPFRIQALFVAPSEEILFRKY
jgi:centromere protein I